MIKTEMSVNPLMFMNERKNVSLEIEERSSITDTVTLSSWELKATDNIIELGIGVNPLIIEEITKGGDLPKSLSYEHSPFGFHPAENVLKPQNLERYSDALEIGIKWHRPGIYLFWPAVQTKEDIQQGVFHWRNASFPPKNDDEPPPLLDYDNVVYGLQTRAGLNILANLSHIWGNPDPPYAKNSDSWMPFDEEAWRKFVKEAIRRYGSGAVNGIKIKYWQVENEPNFMPPPFVRFRARSAESYAQLLKITYEAIKEADPEAKVLIGGCGGHGWDLGERTLGWYEKVFRVLKGEYMDIFDWHFYGNALGDYRRLGEVIPTLRKVLDIYGYEHVPIWITEMGTYSGTLDDPQGNPDPSTYQGEEEQARDLFKRYVYSLYLGVRKVFWAWALVEGFGYRGGRDGFFDHTGLIYDGRGNDDKGSGIEKKAYYTHRIMTRKLEGCDWEKTERMDTGDDKVCIFKFKRGDKNLYVAWLDREILYSQQP